MNTIVEKGIKAFDFFSFINFLTNDQHEMFVSNLRHFAHDIEQDVLERVEREVIGLDEEPIDEFIEAFVYSSVDRNELRKHQRLTLNTMKGNI